MIPEKRRHGCRRMDEGPGGRMHPANAAWKAQDAAASMLRGRRSPGRIGDEGREKAMRGLLARTQTAPERRRDGRRERGAGRFRHEP